MQNFSGNRLTDGNQDFLRRDLSSPLLVPSVGSKPRECHARKEQEGDAEISGEVWTCFHLSLKEVAIPGSSALTEAVLAPHSLIPVG